MKTYKTVAELAAGYKAGEIKNVDGTVPPLVLDNDNAHVFVGTKMETDGEYVDFIEGDYVFNEDQPPDAPGGLLEQALDLLGIPNEPC